MLKKPLNTIITNIAHFYYKNSLKLTDGIQTVHPKPPYQSQFNKIIPANISMDEILDNPEEIHAYGAKDAEEFSFWVWRNCGIACVKMILDAHQKAPNKTMMDLTRRGIELEGYITHQEGKFVDQGWFHHSLVKLLEENGLTAKSKKWQSLTTVANDIIKNNHVILSVMAPGRSYIQEDGSFKPKQNAKYGGHLILATSVTIENNAVSSITVHDPRGLPNYQADLTISADIFNSIFSNMTIVVGSS